MPPSSTSSLPRRSLDFPRQNPQQRIYRFATDRFPSLRLISQHYGGRSGNIARSLPSENVALSRGKWFIWKITITNSIILYNPNMLSQRTRATLRISRMFPNLLLRSRLDAQLLVTFAMKIFLARKFPRFSV